MSITRQLFREFRPLFRMLEEPITRAPTSYSLRSHPFFDDPFFSSPGFGRPAVDVTEQGNKYVVEADLPGVAKENVEVRIGEGGRSLTIEGKVVSKAPELEPTQASEGEQASSTEVTKTDAPNQISAERQFWSNSSFTRTVWLPRLVDSNGVSAQLKDGVLTVTIPKAEDKASVVVPVQ
ncbi:HSP20-like chaperone [Guyanagaster necrorhizus]|uniref:HSP20-like chaperone n=1 Tax=Guyanagaster necrorhizus TaxID=856835 RepID=A0A9P8APR0_9AGAR|nr:HSP20-like chaperone [Guyanagaster necrorhizus MCA 3950]KAG7443046.1 HSP20-like chaperone [Guyanagaster necrorhizus MCA 3950]